MRWFLVLAIMLALGVTSQAQEAAAFRLLMDNTNLHTGQVYTVFLRIDAADVWAFSATIDADPGLVYIIGSQAGQPLRPAAVLNTAEGMTIFNRVQNNQLEFVYSRLSPAPSAHYSGTVATFEIYPLRAGTVTLRVSEAEANRVSFKMEEGMRVIDTQTLLPVGANELTLTITGDPVAPPLEVTATPIAQSTATVDFSGFEVSVNATAEALRPFLLNDIVTAGPPESEASASEMSQQDSPLQIIAFGLISFALMGFVSLWLFRQRRD